MTLESAVAHLATMEAQRTRALDAVRQVAEMHDQALSAYNEAAKLRDEALAAVIHAGNPEARVVKRPITAADELLDLDDVGGH